MKIGIITWFKYENYGTALQAFALQKYLKNNRHNIELINFNVDDSLNNNKIKKMNLYAFIGKVFLKLEKLFFKKSFIQRTQKFNNFIENNCTLSKKINTEKEFIDTCNKYDLIICGSDQIWNPNWYHPFYYANFKSIRTKRIAYAPSFGVENIEKNKQKEIKNALLKFDFLTAREESGCEIVKKLINKDISVVVDPTLLLNAKEWEKYENKELDLPDEYILCYFLSDNKNHWKAVKKFAKKKNLKLFIIPYKGHSYIKSKYTLKSCGVEDFLSLFHNAKYVVTDSFHACVFSVIYDKKFIVFERHNPLSSTAQNTRIYNFLNMIKSRQKLLLNYNESIIPDLDNIDYKVINKEINKYINSSKIILEEMIERDV